MSSGEGGALLINEPRWTERAEVLRAMGTNRARFMRGQVDRYTWVDTGSSFVMSDVTAVLLRGQLERLAAITEARLVIWDAYHAAFEGLERAGMSAPAPLRRRRGPQRPHLLRAARGRRRGATRSSACCAEDRIGASSHYEPLHASPAGRRLGRVHGEMTHTESVAARLLRVPLWVGMTEDDVARVADRLERALRGAA